MRCSIVMPAVGMLLVGLASRQAGAQSCTGNGCNVTTTATLTVPDVLSLTLSSLTTSLGTPGTADFAASGITASGPNATVVSNRPWHVSVIANAAEFAYSGSLTNPHKPASDLTWGTVAGTYGNSADVSATLFGGNGTAGSSQQIFYRTLLSYGNDITGSYALDVKFTLSAP